MKTAPSIKNLVSSLHVDKETAIKIRAIWIEWPIETILENCPQTAAWERSCYNTPKPRHVRREAIDETLGTFGVEVLGQHRRTGDFVSYCNAGDTYATTLIFHGDRLQIGCWGDFIERNTVKEFQQY